jgi:hypothetical protein
MNQCAATINGKLVYSDKTVSSINNTKITFTDGSWCDVGTGYVENKGPGYIRLGTPETGTEEKKTIGPKIFNTRRLEVSHVCGTVEIQPTTDEHMTVTITGSATDVDNIDVAQIANTLVINGTGGSSSSHGSIVVGRGNVSVSGNNIHISQSNMSFMSNMKIISGDDAPGPQVTVHVPKGSGICVSGIIGDTKIGDTEGDLKVSSVGSSTVTAGKVASANLSLQGSGDISVASVEKELTMSVQGSGDIRVRDGTVSQLKANVMGSGDIRFGGKAEDAQLSVMGSGDIDVAHVKNEPTKSKMGSGDIRVRETG